MADLFGTLIVLLSFFLFAVFFSWLEVSREEEKKAKRKAYLETYTNDAFENTEHVYY
ncbi:hypothetical protein [Floricoccus tropicus]|uniref:hypothetical protein n=1 Tax=Floricoccus tropicus TaxID=1859473 RepID=UPI00130126AB|nr:hypothetical protein [Floricoccus tropicus]